jgi:sugar phosphate isomerase/epimerase
MKPSFFRGIVGNSPDPNNLSATHVHLKDIKADTREEALARMQENIFSPNGEAFDLIQSKELQHTSMTIGDVLVDEAGVIHQVTAIGFSQLPKHEEPQ